MEKKIGLMVGREWSFPPAFVEEVERREGGWRVEYVKLGTPIPANPSEYAVIVDRISHAVPFYRSYLKQAALAGVRIINDPFVESTTDRFVAAAVARLDGVQSPKRMALPHREYAEGIIHEESLRNLDYPLDWEAVAAYVGLPCLIKDANGHGDPRHVCHSVDEILQYYNESGQRMLIVQEIIQGAEEVRCFVLGEGDGLVLGYDPESRSYDLAAGGVASGLSTEILTESRRITRALGFDINVVDWAIRDGEMYAIELMDPTPDIDIYELGSKHFEWMVQRIADLAIGLAEEARPHGASAGETDGDRGEDQGDLAEDLPSLARDLPRSDLQ